MIISIIAAMDKGRGIGKDNKLPWNVPADLNFFKQKTLLKPIIMGWNTFLSLGSKPLPERFNIVISNKEVSIPQLNNLAFVNSPEGALSLAKDSLSKIDDRELNDDDEIFVIGGTKTYDSFIPYVDRMYLTFLDLDSDCDSFFPDFDESKWGGIILDSGVSNKVPYEIYQFDILEN